MFMVPGDGGDDAEPQSDIGQVEADQQVLAEAARDPLLAQAMGIAWVPRVAKKKPAASAAFVAPACAGVPSFPRIKTNLLLASIAPAANVIQVMYTFAFIFNA